MKRFVFVIIALAALPLLIGGCSESNDAGVNPPDNNSDWLIPANEIAQGCFGKDCIPSLSAPRRVVPADAGYLRDADLVIGVVVNGEAAAYPYPVLNWHEIVNDRVGGRDIVVSYCPLTASSYGFDAKVGGQVSSFGVSGLLYNNNLIMYDRQTKGHYAQMLFMGVEGANQGEKLDAVYYVETTWALWKQMFPATTVLSNNTGIQRDYNRYPYGDYWTNHSFLLFPISNDDSRLNRKDRVLGIYDADEAWAYPLVSLARNGPDVRNDELGTHKVVVASYGNNGLMANLAIAFDRVVNGRELTFSATGGTFPFQLKDDQTGSTWNLEGDAVSGELIGTGLERMPGYNAFWFAWAAFYPRTQVMGRQQAVE